MSETKKKQIAIGVEDFKTIIEKGGYFVDKTLMIKQLIESQAMATLFTRPRRFGKTLNQFMIRRFFEDEITEKDEKIDNGYLFDGLAIGVSKITCGFSKINCGMESWANGNSPKSVVGRNRWILNKKMVKKSGNRVTFGCLIWYKTYFLYYLNFGPFTACFLYGSLVLSVRKQTFFHGLGTAKMAAFFRCEKRNRFRICSKFP